MVRENAGLGLRILGIFIVIVATLLSMYAAASAESPTVGDEGSYEPINRANFIIMALVIPGIIIGMIIYGAGWAQANGPDQLEQLARILKRSSGMKIADIARLIHRSEEDTRELIAKCITRNMVDGSIDFDNGRFRLFDKPKQISDIDLDIGSEEDGAVVPYLDLGSMERISGLSEVEIEETEEGRIAKLVNGLQEGDEVSSAEAGVDINDIISDVETQVNLREWEDMLYEHPDKMVKKEKKSVLLVPPGAPRGVRAQRGRKLDAQQVAKVPEKRAVEATRTGFSEKPSVRPVSKKRRKKKPSPPAEQIQLCDRCSKPMVFKEQRGIHVCPWCG